MVYWLKGANMAKKNQKFNKYTEGERLKFTELILKGKKSYKAVSEEYDVPIGTLAVWVKKYREKGNLKTEKQGRPTKAKSDKERIKELELENEILKKFQAFLEQQ